MTDKRMKMKRFRMSSEESDSSSMSSSQSSSSDEEVDAKDLKPIREYLSNRKELASQLFKSVKAEKIRMMLPQILKKIEFNDLEELCTAELTGMSKQRIMCILNGKEMMESSNTEDSDDSGPSLEIISDTEWLSDNETNIKIEGAKKHKNLKKLKKKSQDQKNTDIKSKLKNKGKDKLGKNGGTNIKVKTEVVKNEKKEKEKEGESLLDLLELEMRARAIRALIRKEEDTSSNSNTTNVQSNNSINAASGSGNPNDKKSRQSSLREQLEKIDVLMKHGEDEDVYVVINPAPTIELLSSESENEDASKRVNQRLVSERESVNNGNQEKDDNLIAKNNDTKTAQTTVNEKDVRKEIDSNKNKEYITQDKHTSNDNDKNTNGKETSQKENLNLPMSVTESSTIDSPINPNQPVEELEEGEIIDNDDNEEISKEEKKIVDDSFSKRKIKKIKKNPHIRTRKANEENDDSDEKSNQDTDTEKDKSNSESSKKSINKKDQSFVASEEPIEIQDSPRIMEEKDNIVNFTTVNEDSNSKLDLYDDKALDIDEIINLDDYPDDIDDLERSQAIHKQKSPIKEIDSSVTESDKVATSKSSETWASRYYQQDDVQNVIKESKIQSEIRKRLRERQRQNKMNNSPKLKDPVDISSADVVTLKPTGSVEEYLALKGGSDDTCNKMVEGKSDNIELFQPLKKDDLQSDDNNPITMKDDLPLNNLSTNDVKLIDQPVTIVKKPKLFEDIAIAKKINSILNDNSSVEHINSAPTCVERINSILNDKKLIMIKEDEPLNDKKIIIVKSPEISKLENKTIQLADNEVDVIQDDSTNQDIVKQRNEELINSPLRGDINTPKSDSSEDNIIVRIDSTLPQDNTIITNVSVQEEQTTSSDTGTSELRPD